MFYERFFAPKKKKNKHTVAKIIGIIAIISLIPLAFRHDDKKKEWGWGSLLLSVSGRPSTKVPGKREIEVSIPGISFIKKCYSEASMLCTKASKDKSSCDAADADASDESFADELSGVSEPEITVTEE